MFLSSFPLFYCICVNHAGFSFSETQETYTGQNDIPLTLRLRTAVATALGAAAAHAKLLADKEDREIENLVTTIIETQVGHFATSVSVIVDSTTKVFFEATGA